MSRFPAGDRSMAAARARGAQNAADPDHPHEIRDWSVEPPYALPTTEKRYLDFRKTQPRSAPTRKSAGGRPVATTAMPSPPPDGVRLVPDVDGVHQWTDPYGACILAGVSRRTIYAWKNRGWLKIRYMASAKLEIRVDSLWWSAEEREAHKVAQAPAAPIAGVLTAADGTVLDDAVVDGYNDVLDDYNEIDTE